MATLEDRSNGIDERWQTPGAGRHYSSARWRSGRAADRDPALLRRALRLVPSFQPGASVLDIPSGTGRLHHTLAAAGANYVGADVSMEMLRADGEGSRLRASAWRLPFRDRSFDLVVCCRLLHHVTAPDQRQTLLRELLRVSRGPLIASFWDAASLHAWRRRHGMRSSSRLDRRVAVNRATLEQHLEELNAEVVDYLHSFRFISQQAFFVAQRTS